MRRRKSCIEYSCKNCLRSFGNKKDHYEAHMNRKNPCKPKIVENKLDGGLNIINDCDDEKKIEHEKFDFTNIDFNQDYDINDNKLMIRLIEKIDLLVKQNEECKDEIEKLKSQLTTSNSKSQILYKPDININVQINNFNNIDYSKIDKKMLINTLVQNTGKQIYLKAIENVYINPECPQNHSIYVADKNRGYIKKYNNGRWETDNLNIIDLLINNFVDYYKLSLEEIKQKPELHNKLKNNIQTKLKYLDLCDLEYLANLEDEQENEEVDNKKQIKRCKEFREMVYKDMINLLHDKKDIVISTHKNI
jgi:hypothetical protein